MRISLYHLSLRLRKISSPRHPCPHVGAKESLSLLLSRTLRIGSTIWEHKLDPIKTSRIQASSPLPSMAKCQMTHSLAHLIFTSASVKNLVEAQGGRVWSRSDDSGVCFAFALPSSPIDGAPPLE